MADHIEAGTVPAPDPAGQTSVLDAEMAVTVFDNCWGKTGEGWWITPRALAQQIRREHAPNKPSLALLKLARFGGRCSAKGSLRHNANVLSISGIEAEHDARTMPLDQAETALQAAGIAAILYTSPSHTATGPKWRVLCPLSKELPPEARSLLVSRLNGALNGVLAPESWTLSQAFYFGSVDKNPEHEVRLIDGTAIDLLSSLDAGAIGKPRVEKAPRAVTAPPASGGGDRQQDTTGGRATTAYIRAALSSAATTVAYAPPGMRNLTLNAQAFALARFVANGQLDADTFVLELATAAITAGLGEGEIRATLRSALTAGLRKHPAGTEGDAP